MQVNALILKEVKAVAEKPKKDIGKGAYSC